MKTVNLDVLLHRTSSGNQAAFAELYQRCSAKLNGIAYLMLRDKEKANQVLQDAFMQIWQHADQYNPSLGEPMTWMSSIVRFRALDMIRKEKRRIEGRFMQLEDTELSQLESKIQWQQEQVSATHLSDGLQRCVQQLPDNHRNAIFFAYLYGHSRDDIAQVFDTSVNTVKSWLHRGIRSLQQCLTH